MVPRTSSFGKFWGCNSYPRCTGTRDATGRSKAEREVEDEAQPYHRKWDRR